MTAYNLLESIGTSADPFVSLERSKVEWLTIWKGELLVGGWWGRGERADHAGHRWLGCFWTPLQDKGEVNRGFSLSSHPHSIRGFTSNASPHITHFLHSSFFILHVRLHIHAKMCSCMYIYFKTKMPSCNNCPQRRHHALWRPVELRKTLIAIQSIEYTPHLHIVNNSIIYALCGLLILLSLLWSIISIWNSGYACGVCVSSCMSIFIHVHNCVSPDLITSLRKDTLEEAISPHSWTDLHD